MLALVLSRAICCLGAFSCAQECNESGYSDWWETAIVADIQALIVLGLDVMTRGDHRQTALHRGTIINDDLSTIKVLLDAVADVMARDKNEATPWEFVQNNEFLKGTAACWGLPLSPDNR
ncbi:hypothetical protein N8912_05045 [Rhodobacteraceae bacterium]|nr:hypothetical protein [Paracoccaceae bacterium]